MLKKGIYERLHKAKMSNGTFYKEIIWIMYRGTQTAYRYTEYEK